LGDLWKRPGLSPRDRSIVTLAALVARGQTVEMPFYINLALDNGLRPAELSEIITHLAFYSGWANAMAAAAVAKDVFAGRRIGSARATGLLCRLAERVLGASGREERLGEAAGSAAARKSRVDHETETDRRRQGRHRHLGRQRNRTGLRVPHAHDADDG